MATYAVTPGQSINTVFSSNDLGGGDTVELRASSLGSSHTYTEDVVVGTNDDGWGAGSIVTLASRAGDSVTIQSSGGTYALSIPSTDYFKTENITVVGGSVAAIRATGNGQLFSNIIAYSTSTDAVGLYASAALTFSADLLKCNGSHGKGAFFNAACSGSITRSQFNNNGAQGAHGNLGGLSFNSCDFSYNNGHGYWNQVASVVAQSVLNCTSHDNFDTAAGEYRHGFVWAPSSGTISNITVDSCISYNVDLALDIQATSGNISNAVVKNSSLVGKGPGQLTRGHGVYLGASSSSYSNSSIFFYNNIIGTEDALGAGLFVGQYNNANIKFRNNIIFNLAGGSVVTYKTGAPYLDSDYNVFWSTKAKPFSIGGVDYTFAEYQALSGKDAHSVFLNPLFISSTDYHLQPTSPCIGAGTAISGITTDIEGNQLYPPYNIGPYGAASGALEQSASDHTGRAKYNITADSDWNNATMPDCDEARLATGWTDGNANSFYQADGTPIANVPKATLFEFAVGPRLFYNPDKATKGLALYSADNDAANELKVWKAMGTSYALPTPTAFFNGIDTTGMTSFTGGPTTFADNDGKLRIAPTNNLAKTGMMVATTYDNGTGGATLGAETASPNFEVPGDWGTSGGWVGGITVGQAVLTANAVIGTVFKSSGVIGKRYLIAVIVPSVGGGGVGIRMGSTFGPTISTPGTHTFEGVQTASTTIGLAALAKTSTCTITRLSIREVIPQYYDTTSTGTPIVASTDQVTRTGDANFYVFTNNPAVKRYSIANPLTMPGFLCEPARTNKVTCMKRNPTVTTNITASGSTTNGGLSIVTDLVIITTAGLEKICTSGAFYRLNNSTGGSAATATIAGNDDTTAHARSAYIKGGTGRIGISSTVGTTFTAAANFTRRVDLRTSAGGIGTVITADAGQIVDFILPQLEAGAFETSPICQLDQAAAESRLATVLTYPTAGKIRSNNMAFRMIVVPRASGQNAARLFSMYSDAGNKLFLTLNTSNITFSKQIDGTYYEPLINYTHINGTPIDILFIMSTSGIFIASRAWSGSNYGPWSSVGNVSTVSNISIPSTFQIGAYQSNQQFTGNISLFDTLPIPSGITDPLAWAKQQWGIA